MYAAIAELSVVQVGFFGAFAGQFRDTGYGFAFLFVFLDFLLQDIGDVKVAMEVIIYVFLDEVSHEFVDADARQWERIAV